MIKKEPAPPASAPLPAAHVVKSRRGFSPVWIIPIVAAFVGLWLAGQHYYSQGPLIEVQFETAEGVEAGKTSVQCRSVTVGKVESVRLGPNLRNVEIKLRISRDEAHLLRQDTQFWVVRPRLGGGSISGLGTLVSGSYIELSPGVSQTEGTRYKGLENPPVTPQGVPGLHLTLVSDIAGSLAPGSVIYYKGFGVGRVESRKFNLLTQQVEFGVFIDGAYGKLVTDHTRFWNVSGIDLDVSSSGVRLRTGTLESLVAGGIAFGSEDTGVAHKPVVDGCVFPLYAAEDEQDQLTLNPRLPFLLLFKESVRGLGKDAPVEFRGIRVGTVMDVSFNYLPEDPEHRVPVLIKLDPSLFADLQANDIEAGNEFVARSVRSGLRATLSTGSLLTGQLFVDLNLQEKAPYAEITEVDGYRVIPTVSSGLTSLQEKVAAVLDKIQALPLENTVQNINDATLQARKAIMDFDQLLASKETQSLPAEVRASLTSLRKTIDGYDKNSAFYIQLDATLNQLNATLRSVDSLSTTIERKPSSLIWGNPKGKVAPPRAKPATP